MKSKKRWFVTALTACLTLSLGICAEALAYDFDGVEDTAYYPSTSYESCLLYTSKWCTNEGYTGVAWTQQL